MGDPRVNESDEQKKVASFWGELTGDTRTVMTKKVASFFPGKTGSGEEPPLFSEQGPAESKSGRDSILFFLNLCLLNWFSLLAPNVVGLHFPHAQYVWQWLRLGYFITRLIKALFINKLSYVAIQCVSW